MLPPIRQPMSSKQEKRKPSVCSMLRPSQTVHVEQLVATMEPATLLQSAPHLGELPRELVPPHLVSAVSSIWHAEPPRHRTTLMPSLAPSPRVQMLTPVHTKSAKQTAMSASSG